MKQTLYIILSITGLFVSGCTQMVTAPIHATAAVVSGTIDIAGSAVHAVSGSEEDEEKED
jgi:hypothetical protein